MTASVQPKRFRFGALLAATVLTVLLIWLFGTVAHVLVLLFLGILTGRRQKMQPPVDPDGFMDPLEEAALQQMTRYSFIGGPQKVRKELEAFIKLTGADELMVSTPVYGHEARLDSYGILSSL